MPSNDADQQFDTIESAHDFMGVLAETVVNAIKDLHRDYQIALKDGDSRRARAIELALFKARSLNLYVHKSRRMLNDLRTIRRLILNERATTEEGVSVAKVMRAGA